MEPEIENRSIALVTGVGRRQGIGAEICRRLGANGFDIAYSWWEAADLSAPWGSDEGFGYAFADELRALGVQAVGIEADLSDPATPERIMRDAREALGPITVLVNNAAVSEQGSIDDLTADSLDRHLAVNVRGMAMLTKAFIQQVSAGAGGRIVNLTSGQGLGPMPDELAYVASKGAVEALTVSMAPSLAAWGITVNAVNPGPTDTGWMSEEVRAEILARTPGGRLGQPDDAARLVAFLASADAGWITGQIIHSEGGFLR